MLSSLFGLVVLIQDTYKIPTMCSASNRLSAATSNSASFAASFALRGARKLVGSTASTVAVPGNSSDQPPRPSRRP
eukprot:1140444-Prorocentrum_minimum.AAC.1